MILTAFLLMAAPAWGKVRLSRTVPVKMQIQREKKSQWKDLNKIVPRDLVSIDAEDRTDAGFVFTKFGDQALQQWFESPEVRNSSIGRTANSVEKAMKTEVSLPGDSKSGIDHKVSFQVLALQSATKVEYKGWTNAAWNYDTRKRASKVEVSERVWRDKDLTLSHTANAQEDVSAVGVRWNW